MSAVPAIQITTEAYPRCSLTTPRWWAGEVPLEGHRVFVAGGKDHRAVLDHQGRIWLLGGQGHRWPKPRPTTREDYD